MAMTADERERLIRLARRALEARVGRRPAPPLEGGGVLDRPMGAFVTIRRAGELRQALATVDGVVTRNPRAPGALLMKGRLEAELGVATSDS